MQAGPGALRRFAALLSAAIENGPELVILQQIRQDRGRGSWFTDALARAVLAWCAGHRRGSLSQY